MRRAQLNSLLIGGLLFAVLLGVLAGHFARGPAVPGLQSAMKLGQSRPIPSIELIDEQEQPVDNIALQGHWHLVFFGFTHCPDICPSTLSMLKQVVAGLAPELAARLRVVFVSVDPERDTPERLGQYVAHFDPDFRALTGQAENLEKFATALSSAFVRVPQGDSYTMDHTTALVLLNPAVEVSAFLPAPHDIPTMISDLSVLLKAP